MAEVGGLQIRITGTEERSSMLKSWCVYMLEVNDFGRKSVLEKRFDDFSLLHADMKEIDADTPPLPEKKFMASTDASVVAERRPAFERILKHLLKSEAAVMEKSQTVFKFLELPTPAVVAFRYLFQYDRISCARQCGKLTDPKWEKEHAYRLAHPVMVRTSLQMLLEGALQDSREETKRDPAVLADAEAAVLEMLRFAVQSEQGRQCFLQEKGPATLLSYIFRKGKKEENAGPDQRARGVLNALIKVEGDRFPQVMAGFLEHGGVGVLREGLDLLQHPGFADFVSKLLWLAWDVQVQQVFLAEGHSREALGLLSSLFECPSKGARACAGLLLACALCNAQLAGRESQAAHGLAQLTEEMVAFNCWDAKESSEDAELRAFVQGLGQSPERFARILTCAQAPWQHNDGQLPDEDHPLWPGASFCLWCLLRMRPEPSRLAPLRPALPAVAQGGPARARWLAGELLLQLQLQVTGDINSVDSIVETSIQERGALESALLEEFEHGRRSLHAELSESSQVIQTQQSLVEDRQQRLPMEAAGSVGSGWHQDLEAALAQLERARQELSGALAAAEKKREAAQSAVREVLDMDLTDSEDQMEQQLHAMRQTEAEYQARRAEQEQHSAVLKSHEEQVAAANSIMEAADRALQEMRSRISGTEVEITKRQREVQSKRTMASSDLSATRGALSAELDGIKQQQTKLRDRALQLQAEEGHEGAAKEMDRLKAEAGRLKARGAELNQELQAASVDPQQLEQQAQQAEAAVQRLAEQRDALRAELQSLEEEHLQARQEWQQAMSSLQHSRQEKEVADLQSSSLKRQLEGQWSSWLPTWTRRLQAWRQRVEALSRARKGAELLGAAAQLGWEALRREAQKRQETRTAVQHLQHQLAELAHGLAIQDDTLQ